MMKKILATYCLLFATCSVASGVSMEMFQMKRQFNALVQADNSESFNQAAVAFIRESKLAQEKMPRSLDGDQERFKGYQAAMQEVIDVVAHADQLAQKGNLNHAKQLIKQVDKLKSIYHAEYR